MPKNNDPKGKNISQVEYYRYKLFWRDNDSNVLLKSGKLWQQYLTDVWSRTENGRLNFHRRKNQKYRRETMNGLLDAANIHDYTDVGDRVILSASHMESPRHFYTCFLNDMAIGRVCKKPDVFATMTANESWPEIQRNLYNSQTACHRAELVCRVFRLKNLQFRKDLKDRNVFGDCCALCNGNEFQKRGPPHTHSVGTLKGEWKLKVPERVDRIISARIPNPNTHANLYRLVTSLMLHTRYVAVQ